MLNKPFLAHLFVYFTTLLWSKPSLFPIFGVIFVDFSVLDHHLSQFFGVKPPFFPFFLCKTSISPREARDLRGTLIVPLAQRWPPRHAAAAAETGHGRRLWEFSDLVMAETELWVISMVDICTSLYLYLCCYIWLISMLLYIYIYG